MTTPGEPPQETSRFPVGEILVVLVVIAGMVAVAVPSAKFVVHRSKITEVRSAMDRLMAAVVTYRQVYHHYPAVTPEEGAVSTSAESGLMDILAPLPGKPPPRGNPQGRQFFQTREGKDRKFAEIKDGALLDPWGHPYHVLFDSDGNGKIANPFAGKPGQSEWLTYGVIVWSDGPDGTPDTDDDLKSWE